MTDRLDLLSYEWSLIDGQGLVRVVPISSYKAGFVLISHIGIIADSYAYYPQLTLSREKVTIVIDDENEDLAYKIAGEIDTLLEDAAGTE